MSDSQRIEFWLAGVVLDLKFALDSLSGIFPPFSSYISKLGNTNKCYPPLCGNIFKLSNLGTLHLPLLFNLYSSPSINFKTFSSSLAGGLPIWSCLPCFSDHPLVTLYYPG